MLRMKVCGEPFFAATTVFNPNAFPKSLKNKVEAACYRLALLFHSKQQLRETIREAASDFLMHLHRNWNGYTGASTKSRKDAIVYADGVAYLSEFHQFLFQTKSFLDVLAILICQLLNPKSDPVKGFNKEKVDGRKISGGKLTTWLERSWGGEDAKKREIVGILRHHGGDWITDVVNFRDTLAHFGEINGFEHMRVHVTKDAAEPRLVDVAMPSMPDGTDIVEYAETVKAKLGSFCEELLAALPIEHRLVGSWKPATDKF